MKRSRFFSSILAVCALAFACSASAKVVAQVLITPNSECGALAVGHPSTDLNVAIEHQGEGLRVNASGIWETCSQKKPTATPPAPIGCQVPSSYSWSDGDNVCVTASIADIPSGSQITMNARTGSTEGSVSLRCTNGDLATVQSTCSRTLYCVGRFQPSEDDGKTKWRWSGTLKEGAYSIAVADDGRTRRVQCQGGWIHLR